VIEDRAEHVQATVTEILGVLEITDFDAEVEAITLHALLEGLNVNVCLGRLEPAAAVETARLHLVHVAARARAARVAG
jgi:hypothetical protein